MNLVNFLGWVTLAASLSCIYFVLQWARALDRREKALNRMADAVILHNEALTTYLKACATALKGVER